MTLYYYEETTMKEIGLILGVVESRISQIHASAVLHLRARLSRFRHPRGASHQLSPAGAVFPAAPISQERARSLLPDASFADKMFFRLLLTGPAVTKRPFLSVG